MKIELNWLEPIELGSSSTLRENIKNLDLKPIPDIAGIYVFYREYGGKQYALYVGKSENIRTRMKSHFNSLSLIEGLENTPQGAKKLIFAEVKTRSDLGRALNQAEKGLIQHYIDKGHPLAKQATISLDDLTAYPRLSYEQGTHNSFYYWEEILADIPVPKRIIVSDRATLFNLLIGLDGYTISSGIINDDLNSPDILAIPLESDEVIELGYLTANRHQLSSIAKRYLGLLEESIQQYAK